MKKLFLLALLCVFIFFNKDSSSQSSSGLPALTLKNSSKEKLSLKNIFPKKSLTQIANQKNSFFKFDKKTYPKPRTEFNKPILKIKNDYKPWESKKRFWVAAGEVALLEFLPFAYSAYIKDWSGSTEKNWTKISFESMWHNIENGWIYDGDNFLTNFFAHPYHGNLFFNAGRTNGYDFWESSAFAMSGSAFWEQFMETWEPAFNDWVLTSLNGINLGEITYRLATFVTDNNARGSTRTWLEIAGAVINPVRAFNRLISGETSRIFPNPEWRMPKNFLLTLSAGSRRLDQNNGVNFAKDGVQEGLFEMELLYGNNFKKLSTPFSEFSFNIQIASSGPNLARLSTKGNLFGYKLSQSKSVTQYFIESLNYNYINNPGFLYGAASFNSNYNVNFALGPKSSIGTNLVLLLIPMGATPDDYFEGPEGRNYDFGPGVGGGLNAFWKIGPWKIVDVAYVSQWLWTQSEPPDSKHHLHFANIEAQYPFKNYFAIGVSAGVYWRNSFYTYEPDVEFTTPVARVFFKTILQSSKSETAQVDQGYQGRKSYSEIKKSNDWTKNLSDMILIEGTYQRNLSSFSEIYNKAYSFYGGYGKHFSNKYHLIFKSGYAQYELREQYDNDTGYSSLSAIPIQLGGRYYVLKNRVMPYFSFFNGINLLFGKNDLQGNPDDKTLVKYMWQVGFGLSFKLMKQLNFDVSANYNDNFYEPEAMLTSFQYNAALSFNLR